MRLPWRAIFRLVGAAFRTLGERYLYRLPELRASLETGTSLLILTITGQYAEFYKFYRDNRFLFNSMASQLKPQKSKLAPDFDRISFADAFCGDGVSGSGKQKRICLS